jgi:hypothetical protein
MKPLGLNYDINLEKSFMWYSSMSSDQKNKKSRKYLSQIKNKNHSVSLGTIATGILETEPILSPKNLEKDLLFVKNSGFNKVTIFRLGGLNRDYLDIIKKFQG